MNKDEDNTAHLRVPIDATFFIRLSGCLWIESGKLRERGRQSESLIVGAISEAISSALMQLGAEREPKEDSDAE